MNSFLIQVLYSWWRWLVSFNINVVEYSITEQLPLEGLSCLTCLKTLSRKLLDTSKDGGVYPVLVLNHPDTEKAFPDVQMEAPVIQLMCTASCPITGTTRHFGHHWMLGILYYFQGWRLYNFSEQPIQVLNQPKVKRKLCLCGQYCISV